MLTMILCVCVCVCVCARFPASYVEPCDAPKGVASGGEKGEVLLFRVRALYNYSAQHSQELTMKKGETLDVVEGKPCASYSAQHWHLVRNVSGKQGYVPVTYVEKVADKAPKKPVTPKPSAPKPAVAKQGSRRPISSRPLAPKPPSARSPVLKRANKPSASAGAGGAGGNAAQLRDQVAKAAAELSSLKKSLLNYDALIEAEREKVRRIARLCSQKMTLV